MNKTQKGQLKYLNVAPRKTRLISDTLKGLSVAEAEAQLLLRPQRAAKPLLKLLRSTAANAKNNANMDASRLVISQIYVDGGPVLKRFLPRAQGRATPILKRMSHITIVLQEAEKAPSARFVIAQPEKKAKKPKKEKEGKEKAEEKKPKTNKPEKKEAEKSRQGIFKRVFQRKSI